MLIIIIAVVLFVLIIVNSALVVKSTAIKVEQELLEEEVKPIVDYVCNIGNLLTERVNFENDLEANLGLNGFMAKVVCPENFPSLSLEDWVRKANIVWSIIDCYEDNHHWLDACHANLEPWDFIERMKSYYLGGEKDE